MAERMQKTLLRVRREFIEQFKDAMKRRGVNQSQLAERMGVSKARVSQLMNPKRNTRLSSWVRMARALGMKMAIVGHDAPKPVRAEVFVKCWEQAGQPRDFWELNQ